MFSANDKLYTCSECLKRFRSEQNLREHLRTHTGERPYKCRICDKTFKTSGTRCRHERSHEGSHEFLRKPAKPIIIKKTYACTRCSEQFSSGVARSKHMKKSHKLSGQYFCLQCNIELSSVEDLVRHHSSEHSSEQLINQDSSLTDEHQDHAYHRPPLNDMNVNSTESLVEKESPANTSSNMLKNSPEHQKQGLAELGYMEVVGRQKNFGSTDHFVCKYCEKEFSKLPVFLKHLLKHSEARKIESEPSDVKNESFTDDSEVAVENAFADNGQTVMMSCRSSPVLVEVKNECESETLYLAELDDSPEVERDLQKLVDEFTLHEIDCEGQDLEQNLSGQTANLSSGRISRKQTKRHKQKKEHGEKSDQRISYCNSDNSVHGGSRVSDVRGIQGLHEDESNETVNENIQEDHQNGAESNSEDDRTSFLERAKCVLDCNKNHMFCEKCGGKLNASSEERYTCNACGESFSSIQPTEDGDSLTSLSVQDGEISYSLRRKASPKANSAKKSYSCKHCNIIFKTKKQCDLHKKAHVISNAVRSVRHDRAAEASEEKVRADKEPFSCTVCGRRFAVKYRLHRHMIIHTGEKPFVCNECGKAFTTNAYLKSHMARHTNELTYLCSTCGKRFADRIAWRYHKRVHDLARRTNNLTVKEHICWVCGFQFNRASNLARHELKHRNSEEFLHKCDECGRKFRTKEGYRYHIGQHAPEKPYLCMDCPKAFADSFCLKTHLKSHAQQGSFECGVCGKKYRTMFILKMHAKHHTELRYSCDVCGETFGFARQFRSHLIKHRPPFRCEVCGVTTTRAADLRKHKKRFQH